MVRRTIDCLLPMWGSLGFEEVFVVAWRRSCHWSGVKVAYVEMEMGTEQLCCVSTWRTP
jgi:hypothetical protein